MVVTEEINQGDILKIEKIKVPVFVASKNIFNQSGEIIGCPIYIEGRQGPLHIQVDAEGVSGTVQCEKMRLLDLRMRGCCKIGRARLADIMEVTDAIQSIFDYV